MRPHTIVGRPARISAIQEPVSIGLVAQLPLETLHVRVLDRFASVDEVWADALLVGLLEWPAAGL